MSGHRTIEPLLVCHGTGWGKDKEALCCLPRARLPLLPHIPSLSLSYGVKANGLPESRKGKECE